MEHLKDFRYEKKYVINELNYKEVEGIIKHNPSMFSEIFYERVVNNIYLDSMDLQSYRENLAGNCERIKIRIRWYGKNFGLIKNPVLELKIKNNDLGKKLSFPLKDFILDENFSWGLLQKTLAESNLPEWIKEKLKLCHPTLLSSYKRKYYLSADKEHRITLDWDLIFFKIKNKNNLFKEKIENKSDCILEIKYLSEHYEKTKHITEYIPFRLIANSKYIKGIDLLDL